MKILHAATKTRCSQINKRGWSRRAIFDMRFNATKAGGKRKRCM